MRQGLRRAPPKGDQAFLPCRTLEAVSQIAGIRLSTVRAGWQVRPDDFRWQSQEAVSVGPNLLPQRTGLTSARLARLKSSVFARRPLSRRRPTSSFQQRRPVQHRQ